MSSTNKTPNLELSQFVANDIPSWLGDYNGDMLKIDTAVQSANATASAASGTATTASNQAQNALNVANSAETRSTNNAEDITELKTALTNSLFESTIVANNTTSSFNVISSSDYITKLTVLVGFSDAPTNGTVVGVNTRTPIFSCQSNIFKIGVSTLSDNNSKLYCGVLTLRYNAEPYTSAVGLHAYYDGSNTIFYTVFNSSNIQDWAVLYGNIVVLPTGNFIPTMIV